MDWRSYEGFGRMGGWGVLSLPLMGLGSWIFGHWTSKKHLMGLSGNGEVDMEVAHVRVRGGLRTHACPAWRPALSGPFVDDPNAGSRPEGAAVCRLGAENPPQVPGPAVRKTSHGHGTCSLIETITAIFRYKLLQRCSDWHSVKKPSIQREGHW